MKNWKIVVMPAKDQLLFFLAIRLDFFLKCRFHEIICRRKYLVQRSTHDNKFVF